VWPFVAAGLVVAAALALLVAPHASSAPDGLEKVAHDRGIDADATDHDLSGLPTADYALDGVAEGGLATGLAGLIGIAVTFAIAAGSVWAARRVGARRTAPDPAGAT